MRISPLAIGIGVLAALSGWMVRGVSFDDDDGVVAPPPAAVANAAPPETAPVEDDVLGVITPGSHAEHARSTRNLFAYVEPPPPAPVRVAQVEPQPVYVPPPVVVEAPVVPQKRRLPFAYRYIGNFGPQQREVAAFAHDGSIVTARIGDRIGEHFVLRRIGIESAELEAMVDGEVQTERVPLKH